MFFRGNASKNYAPQPQVLVIWAPGGNNASRVSWPLARAVSKFTTVALVELPCLGIPRLAHEADLLDRLNHTDAAILDFERKNGSPLPFCHKINDNLTVLPANPYALPDHPVVHKVEKVETLQGFPGFFLNQARKSGHSIVIFDCQGSLVSPMTFFALRLANRIVLVVDTPSDIAWALSNIKRLSETYEISETAFTATSPVISSQYCTDMEKVLKCPVVPSEKIFQMVMHNDSH